LLEVYKEKSEAGVDLDSYKRLIGGPDFDKQRETVSRHNNWRQLEENSSRLKNMINDFNTSIEKDYTRDDINVKDINMSKDDSGFTRHDSQIRSNDRDQKKFELPDRSAVLDDVNKNKDESYILKMNKYNEENSIGNMSNTFVVRESSERKAKLDDKRRNELSNSKEN